jgi:hypothetical protein
MSDIYVACGGTSQVNGLYTTDVGGWTKNNDSNYAITLVGSDWCIVENSSGYPQLYKLSGAYPGEPISTTSWISVNGIAPVVKSYVFNFAGIPSLTVSGAGLSDVNGTYTYQNSVLVNYNTGAGNYVSGYLHSSGAYIITADGSSVWSIQFVPSFGGAPVYSSTVPASIVPVDLFFLDTFDTGTSPGPLVSVNDAVFCNIEGTTGGTTGEITETTPYLTGKYVYTNNNTHYIRYNNQSYVR